MPRLPPVTRTTRSRDILLLAPRRVNRTSLPARSTGSLESTRLKETDVTDATNTPPQPSEVPPAPPVPDASSPAAPPYAPPAYGQQPGYGQQPSAAPAHVQPSYPQ